MSRRLLQILICTAALSAGTAVFAQNADQSSPGQRQEDEKPPGILETLEKLKIAQSKKDHDKMLARGEEAVKLSTDLQRTIEVKGSLGEGDLAKVAQVERLVKKIREELGGNGDGEQDDPVPDAEASEPLPQTQKGMVETLKSKADSLYEQLKQTTRFTISASAIVASNAVLKIARFLKLKN